MSDIQKLHKIIETLEEQSLNVAEFNGILRAVNQAKEEVKEIKSDFERFSMEYIDVFSQNFNGIKDFQENKKSLDLKINSLERIQEDILIIIKSLTLDIREHLVEARISFVDLIDIRMAQQKSWIDAYIDTQSRDLKNLVSTQEDMLKVIKSSSLDMREQFSESKIYFEELLDMKMNQQKLLIESYNDAMKKEIKSLGKFVKFSIVIFFIAALAILLQAYLKFL